MSAKDRSTSVHAQDFRNGDGAAALLAAGIGSFAVALFALLADKSNAVKSAMIFYKPTGPLSGVTTSAIIVWLVAWAILHWRWHSSVITLRPITRAALMLLVLSLLLTFPPIADLF
jgi:hypothetical protein